MSKTTNIDPATAELLKRFDAMARRELAKWRLNCVERLIAKGRGKKMPPKYRPKFELSRQRSGDAVHDFSSSSLE